MVKKIECRVIRSVPLTHKTCEHGQPKKANRQFALIKTVKGQNAQLKPYEQSADNTTPLNHKGESGLEKFFGWHKFAEEAAQGQFLDVWA